jgi:hypothetical protein
MDFYSSLSTNSKRAFLRTKRQNGKPYKYLPRPRLLVRLSREAGISIDQAREQLLRERAEILRQTGEL